MGYNTTVVVLNDALAEIAADPEFGARLASAINQVNRGKSVTVAAHGKNSVHCNAAIVIETHHADHDVLVRVGGNTGSIAKDREAASALRAGAEPATPASGWMPIESAPRDGTRVILGRPDDDGDGGASVCGFWLDALEDGVDYMGHDGGFTDADYQVFQPGRSFGAESYRYAESQPTHWQPLPTPPASKGGE